MDAETYSNAEVIEHSTKKFVNVLVFMDGPNDVAKKFGIEAIPTTFLVSPDGDRLRKWEGFLAPDEYRKALDGAVAAVQKLKPLEAQLKTDPDNFELNREAAGHYQALDRNRPAADAWKRAAARASDADTQARLLVRALGQLYQVELSNELNEEIIAVAAQLEKLQADEKIGCKPEALAARAQVMLNRERRDDAIKLFEEIVEAHPGSDKAAMSLLWLADLYHHHKKDNAKALKTLQRLIEKYPKSEVIGDAKEMLEHIREHQDK